MNRDRFRLGKELKDLRSARGRRSGGDWRAHGLNVLRANIDKSCREARLRANKVPPVCYPSDLPICNQRELILKRLRDHQVLIIGGETGSGKTTQLPKFCLEAGRGVTGLIAHTQPRRLAARSVATRIAEELKVELGQAVGYQIRFKDHSNAQTLIKLMTDGILLAEIQRDRFLNNYDTIIIDEAHERSLNIDFLLGHLRQLLPKRPDLKVVITSATIDLERFSRHFDEAPIIQISGRMHPVEYRYQPLLEEENLYVAINNAVGELLTTSIKGDILVFLSGEREVAEAAKNLRRCQFAHLEILPLYARLNIAEQRRIFKPHPGIRAILATNVAETSLTVPGVRYVIDTGRARISRYNVRTKVQQLLVEPISRASADQRAGRCGRVSNGICIRLYSEEDYEQRPRFTTPEILRTNLATVILKMLHLRIGDVRGFPFMESPDTRMVSDGFALLKELKATDSANRLTHVGSQLAQLSVDPRLGRMLLSAQFENCVREVLPIVAALSIQDPRERPAERREAADRAHQQWLDKSSDFISLLNLWAYFEEKRRQMSGKQLRAYCRKSFVSYVRIAEWRELHQQLSRDCRKLGLNSEPERAENDNIHRALLTGLLDNIGLRYEGAEYAGVRNRKFYLFPGSGLAAKPPQWVMCAELIETSRLFGHYNGTINPDWLPRLAGHLVRKNYSEPHYDVKRGEVVALEKQTLRGLTISEGRKVSYGRVSPVESRAIFIQTALVEGGYLKSSRFRSANLPDTNLLNNDQHTGVDANHFTKRGKRSPGPFAIHNAELLAELYNLENRLRRRDIVADEAKLYQFYDHLIPAEVLSLVGFEQWRKTSEKVQPRLLFVDKQLLLINEPTEYQQAQFPQTINWEGTDYQLSYRYEPGHDEDGVSISIPLELLHITPRYRFDWLVPGLLRDKCLALVKNLPKQWRKRFVPIPDTVDRILPKLTVQNKPLTESIGEQLSYLEGVNVPKECWQPEKIDTFYHMNFRLLDESGSPLENSRSLDELRVRYRRRVLDIIGKNAPPTFSKTAFTRWDFGNLPEIHLLFKNDNAIRVYPALCDRKTSVSITLCDSPGLANYNTLRGITRLAMLERRQIVKYLRRELFKNKALLLRAANLPDRHALIEDITQTAFYSACYADHDIPRTSADFHAQLSCGESNIIKQALEIETVFYSMVEELLELHRLMREKSANFPQVIEDVSGQLKQLFRPGFCFVSGMRWLQQYPRYIEAARRRVDRHLEQSGKEIRFQKELAGFLRALAEMSSIEDECLPDLRDQILTFRFMVEEYKVSHYAQQLKTVMPVSGKRLLAYQRGIAERHDFVINIQAV